MTGIWRHCSVSLEPAAGLEAVHLRHHDVQQDEVGLHAGQHLERLLAVCGDTDLVAFALQNGRQGLDVGGRVIDNQNANVELQERDS